MYFCAKPHGQECTSKQDGGYDEGLERDRNAKRQRTPVTHEDDIEEESARINAYGAQQRQGHQPRRPLEPFPESNPI